MTPKGANLEGTDLLEVSTIESGSYVTRSITGQEIIDAVSGGGAAWGSITGTLSTQTDLQNALDAKQDDLVSGTNIKTIEGQSLLGSGDINLTASDVGLGNVDNTSDLNKPISTATQTALNSKQNTLTLTTTGTSGAATLIGATLNIPQYSGGGTSGINNFIKPQIGDSVSSSINATSLSTIVISNNRLYANPFIPVQSITCSSLYVNCSTLAAGALGRILIYSDLNGLPNIKLYESANLDLSTTGLKTATTTFTFNAGTTYWLSFHGSGTASIHSISVGSVIPVKLNGISFSSNFFATSAPSFGSAPSPFGAVTGTNTSVPFIGITL